MPEDGRSHVAQRAAIAKWLGAVAVHDEERHRVGGVRRVRAARRGIDHHLAVAVIRGDEQARPRLLGGRDDAREAHGPPSPPP